MGEINRKNFFNTVRTTLFGGKLSGSQAAGMTAILNGWEKSYADADLRWLAYALATTFHETDRTMQPIEEYGNNAYFNKYEWRADLGNTEKGDGLKFKGRGDVMITGRRNYAVFSKILGIDLINHPEKACEIDVAVKILFYGMTHGTFTGKKLSHYFNAVVEDWKNARRIINRLDKAALIAGYGKNFYKAISYTN